MFYEAFLVISLIGPDDGVEQHIIDRYSGQPECVEKMEDLQEQVPFELECLEWITDKIPM